MLTGKGLGTQPGVGTCVNELDAGVCWLRSVPWPGPAAGGQFRPGDSSRWQVVMVSVVII